MAKKELELENTESKTPALSQEEFEFISKDQAITQDQPEGHDRPYSWIDCAHG